MRFAHALTIYCALTVAVAQILKLLPSKLTSLLKEGKSAAASKHHAQATGKDNDTSLAVIDELAYQLRQQKGLA